MAVTPQEGRLWATPWSRTYLGGAWDAARRGDSLASNPFTGTGPRYTRNYIGIRCARSVLD